MLEYLKTIGVMLLLMAGYWFFIGVLDAFVMSDIAKSVDAVFKSLTLALLTIVAVRVKL